jgi:superfamily II DNA or RNA helicase
VSLFLIHSDDCDNDYGKTFHAPQQQSTIDSYSETGALFLCYCLRTMDRDDIEWATDYPFSTSQRENLDRLNELVYTMSGEIDLNDWTSVIHNCMKSFVNLEETRKQIHESKWAFYRFLVSASVNSTGDGFKPPSSVPHVVKALVFCIRANVFEQARRMDEEDKESGLEFYHPTLTSDGGLFGLKRYIIDKGQTPFNSLRLISNRAARHTANELNFGFASWYLDPENPERYNVLSIYGKTFNYSTFIKGNESLICQAEKLLFIDILGGISLPAVDFQVYEPTESMKEMGYHKSVFTSSNNIYVQYKKHLIDGWLTNTRKRTKMIRGLVNERIVWKQTEVIKWLDKCLMYLELLLVELQLNWGGPARFAEIPSLRITNGQDERRNIYFHDGWLMFLFRYNKTRSMQGKDRNIPRYPPPIIQKQFIYYMTLVRPTISYFLEVFQLPGRKQIKEFLFVDHKIGLWNESQVRRKWSHIMAGVGLGNLNPRIYRQIAQLIMDKRVKFKWQLPDEDDALDESFGHSTTEAVIGYAVEANGGDLVRKDDLAHFRIGSFKWFCETIPNKTVRGRLSKRAREEDSNDEMEIDDVVTENAVAPRCLQSNVVNVLIPRSINTAEILARNQLTSVLPIVNPDVKISAKALMALRSLLNLPTAGFKSIYQAKAVQLYLNRRSDLFVILPTGGGKSLVFELAPLLEPEGTTVLIIPFVALMTEMRGRIKKIVAGFRAEQWVQNRDPLANLPHLLLVSVEEAVSQQFQSFLLNASTNSQIYRFVIDEFHVLLTQADFRPKMNRVVNTVRLLENVPVVCLSATIPLSYIDRIRIQLASINTTVIRAPTDRPNLKYEVHRLTSSAIEDLDWEMGRRLRDAWRLTLDKDKSRLIIYCHTAAACEAFSEFLNKHSEELELSAAVYHSKMERHAKENSYSRWKRGNVKVLVGTGAIGAGLDYPHVRGVWHRGYAGSLIDYIQEVGRAGRDGMEAICVLLYSSTVETKCREFMLAEHMDGMKAYVEEALCLRAHLTNFIDGTGVDCFSSMGLVHCGSCELVLLGETLEIGTGTQRTDARDYDGSLNQMAYKDLTEERRGKLEDIRMLMDILEMRCGVCWFLQSIESKRMDGRMDHLVKNCPAMKHCCLYCYRTGHQSTNCPTFSSGPVFGQGCCHMCGFPQNLFGERIHGFPDIGGCNREGLRDKLASLSWMCWRQKDWKPRFQERFGLQNYSDKNFMAWLGAASDNGVINAVTFCLTFYYTIESIDN